MTSCQKIKVYVRCRPTTGRSVVQVNEEEGEVVVSGKAFNFDQVFSPDSKQTSVYETVVRPMINQVLLGFNCTVFAYGQTGSGKTYTMEGNKEDSGIIPLAVDDLFDKLKTQDHHSTIRVSFLEIHNDDTYDLLATMPDSTRLKIFNDEHRKGSVIVEGLSEIPVTTKDEIYEILRAGANKRQTAATLLNACSSRSHSIFTITIQIRDSDDMLRISKLNLVDLAGSENIGRSGASEKRAREAGGINQSLLALGRVITALIEQRPHIPYRESKLTRILQDSLGGTTKTSIIATISPDVEDQENTLSTLDYASRAKNITNRPELNQKMSKNSIARVDSIALLNERHEAELIELEMNVRNEVALEYKREIQKMQELFDREREDLKKYYEELKSTYESELASEISRLHRDVKMQTSLAETQAELLDRCEKKLKESEADRLSIQQELEDLQARYKELKAAKIRKAPILEETGDYVNTTFSNVDEIAQLSSKKPRKKITVAGKKRVLNQELTLSGKKRKLEPTAEDETSPIAPTRVTRSRATRRKLDF